MGLELAAIGIVQGLLKSLTTFLLDDFLKGRGKDETLPEQLDSTLRLIDAVLIDAEEKQITIDAVKSWVNKVKDAVYVAEDALDDITTDAWRCKETINWLWLHNLPSLSKPKLKKVTETLQSLDKQIHGLNLEVKTRMSRLERPKTTSAIGEQEVLGRQTEKEKIMGILMPDSEDNKKISVLAIVGIGGIGKTALAQLLYNEKDFVSKGFTKAWIHVSQKDNAVSLTKTVYESVTSSPRPSANFDQLQSNLKEWLEVNKILLVLDDVWCETFEEWDLLWKPFASAAKGSRIIVTTRSHHVAENVHAIDSHTHTLQPLPSEECWRLFKEHAHGAQAQDPQKFEIFKEEVTLRCKGLPLAAKAFGGLLRYNKEAGYWRRILESKIWNLSTDSILPVLRVSYHYLPAQLKRCFAYCSIFPKGYAFDRKRLVILWMAEGFLQTEASTEEMEHVGDEYFSELVSRCFFQRDSTDTAKFTMHDLTNELAQFAAGEFCFKYENKIQGITGKTRHLSYLRDQHSGEADKFKELHGAKFLRTFLPLSTKDSSQICCLDKKASHKLLPNLICLRVLSLSHYNVAMLPSDIFKRMRHVRYLDLSRTNLQILPTSVSSLYNLQTLLLSCCLSLVQLGDAICNLLKLEYLDLTTTVNLQQMPQNFGNLKTLQTLTNFVVGADKEAARISVLSDFRNLRGKLTILELHRVSDENEAEAANLKGKDNLKEIDFTWRTPSTVMSTRRQNEVAIFEKLRPHEEIEDITIRKYYGECFPTWMSDPSFKSIVSIRLIDCHWCNSLPSLGTLPCLEELHISKMGQLKRIGSEFLYESRDQEQQPFRSLQVLSFTDMPFLEEWEHVEGLEDYGETLFPSLREVTIMKCPNLTTHLPGLFPSLISLQIYESKMLDFQLDDRKYTQLQRLTIHKSCDSLRTFSLGCFSTLEELEISECSLQSFQLLDMHLPGFSVLRKLTISDCPDLTPLPQGLHQHQNLKLNISGCRNLVD